MLIPDPKIFTFSALFNLLDEMEKRGEELKEREKRRLYHWKGEIELIDFSNKETQRFLNYIKNTLSKERYFVFIKSWLERLYFIFSEISNWISINMEIIRGDTLHSQELIRRLNDYICTNK
jgi:hypothetical protein